MIDKKALQQVKKGAVLINTSRGELVDESAMLEALEMDLLSGVGLDVLVGESKKTSAFPKDSAVFKKKMTGLNILITPHIGGATRESMEETELFMANKLYRLISDN